MKYFKYLLFVIFAMPCWADDFEKMSVAEFHQQLKLDENLSEKFRKDDVLKFHQKNKKEIWGRDGERNLWGNQVPFLKEYKDEEVIKTVLEDKAISDYSSGVLFGWNPLVVATVESKMFDVLGIIYEVDGALGLVEFYNDIESKLDEKSKKSKFTSPAQYQVFC